LSDRINFTKIEIKELYVVMYTSNLIKIFGDSFNSNPVGPEEHKKLSKTVIFVIVAVVIVLLIVGPGSLFLLYQKKKKKSKCCLMINHSLQFLPSRMTADQ
jgi:hypothetical protein